MGSAGVEGELLDSLTGERLAAAVDRRVGSKSIKATTSTWDNVNKSFKYWGQRLRTRLAELRRRS